MAESIDEGYTLGVGFRGLHAGEMRAEGRKGEA